MSALRDPEQTVISCFRSFFHQDGELSMDHGKSFLAAVSGGADSVFLLVMLHRILPAYGCSLSAVTINHRMRSETQSGGDADFVQQLCASLTPPVPCFRVDIETGAVAELAHKRGRGEEEAARSIRYRTFRTLAEEHGIAWICTGHTRDDQLETLLMRTLQGAGTGGMRGIASRNGAVLRPLLGVDRLSLEDWLRSNGFSWREDHTNRETRYFRNRIRTRLVPVLDSVYTGWRKGMLAGASKASLDEDFINSFPLPEWKMEQHRCTCSAAAFRSLHPALRLRLLHRGLILLNVQRRISHRLVSRMVLGPDRMKEGVLASGAGISFSCRDNCVFLESDIVQNRKSGYLVYIASCGEYLLPFGTLRVSGGENSVFIDEKTGPFTFPLVIRSRMGGDTVQTAGGG